MSRLIDADKLMEELTSFSMHITGSHHQDFIVSQCKNSIKRMVDEQPTVDVPDTNVGEWIPCSERMPEEHDSIFKKFKGTDKWRSAMFEKMSDNVNVTVEFEDGVRMSMKGYTVDGKWKPDTAVKCRVIAWMPLPSHTSRRKPNEIQTMARNDRAGNL